jgi:hypothetical protein
MTNHQEHGITEMIMKTPQYSEADIKAAATLMLRAMPEILNGQSLEDAISQVLLRDRNNYELMQREPEIKREVTAEMAKKVYMAVRKNNQAPGAIV